MSAMPVRLSSMTRLRTLAMLGAFAAASGAPAADYVAVAGTRTFSSVLATESDAAPVPIAAFSLRATPVTNAQFLEFVRLHPAWQRDQVASIFAETRYLAAWPDAARIDPAQANQPVVAVSWFAAQAFCASENARLPTWLQWEYAAAADATRTDARDDPAWRERILGWYAQTAGTPVADVGGERNAHGIADLHGLVWEWVDDFNALLVSADNREQGDADRMRFCGAGALSMRDRENYAVLMRIALLSSLSARDVTSSLGFRCARAAPGVKP